MTTDQLVAGQQQSKRNSLLHDYDVNIFGFPIYFPLNPDECIGIIILVTVSDQLAFLPYGLSFVYVCPTTSLPGCSGVLEL